MQVFITSHSKECIDAFVRNDYRTEDISGYVLVPDNGGIRCKHTSGPDLKFMVEKVNADLRKAK